MLQHRLAHDDDGQDQLLDGALSGLDGKGRSRQFEVPKRYLPRWMGGYEVPPPPPPGTPHNAILYSACLTKANFLSLTHHHIHFGHLSPTSIISTLLCSPLAWLALKKDISNYSVSKCSNLFQRPPKSGRSFHHVLQISGTGQRRQTLGNASSLASPNA